MKVHYLLEGTGIVLADPGGGYCTGFGSPRGHLGVSSVSGGNRWRPCSYVGLVYTAGRTMAFCVNHV